MFERLEAIEEKIRKLEEDLSNPDLLANPKEYQKVAKEHAELAPIVETYRNYTKAKAQLAENQELLENEDDPEMQELIRQEMSSLDKSIETAEDELRMMLAPKDPNDEKNVILEIRAGTGGDEAALFAADLFRMYSRYAELQHWNVELLDSHPTGIGGFKEIIAVVNGRGAYSRLKYESGVHRVQRVPVTESQGRIHTSAVTVAVLPEAEEVDIYVDPNELRVDVFRSSGPGGQSVNTTDSAVRITHLPTGVVVQCQNDRSQHKNKANAMKQLRAKLYELELKARTEEKQALEDTKADIGWGSQIRSYVLDQSRIKDLRTNVETGNTQAVLDGDLDRFIEASLKAGL